MAFEQFYYTSCEVGLSGGKGFQVNAVTPGITPRTLNALSGIGDYTPPYNCPKRPTDQEILSAFPISLTYLPLENGDSLLARSVYVGREFVGGDRVRGGNYFCHALIAENINAELNGALPIDLWESPIWVCKPSVTKTLPKLSLPEPPSAFSVQKVEAFLAKGERLQLFPALLTAVLNVMHRVTDRRIVLIDRHDHIALWIAAVSHALPTPITLRLSFSTYTIDPDRSPVLLCGTTTDTDFQCGDIEQSYDYIVFDLEAGKSTMVEPLNPFALIAADAIRARRGAKLHEFSTFYTDAIRLAPVLEGDLFAAHILQMAAKGIYDPEAPAVAARLADAAPSLVERWPALISVFLNVPTLSDDELQRLASHTKNLPGNPIISLLQRSTAALSGEAGGAHLESLLDMLEEGSFSQIRALEKRITDRCVGDLLFECHDPDLLAKSLSRFLGSSTQERFAALTNRLGTGVIGPDVATAAVRFFTALTKLRDKELRGLCGTFLEGCLAELLHCDRMGEADEVFKGIFPAALATGDEDLMRILFRVFQPRDRVSVLCELRRNEYDLDDAIRILWGEQRVPEEACVAILTQPALHDALASSRFPDELASRVLLDGSDPDPCLDRIIAQVPEFLKYDSPAAAWMQLLRSLDSPPRHPQVLLERFSDLAERKPVPGRKVRIWACTRLVRQALEVNGQDGLGPRIIVLMGSDPGWRQSLGHVLFSQMVSARGREFDCSLAILTIILANIGNLDEKARSCLLEIEFPDLFSGFEEQQLTKIGARMHLDHKTREVWEVVTHALDRRYPKSMAHKALLAVKSLFSRIP